MRIEKITNIIREHATIPNTESLVIKHHQEDVNDGELHIIWPV